ncbi:MAG: hypothetical protein CVU66_02470 [Deltaproteobacteria bacterium HGW-Deltaproteobacteria-23]|nr:MAG: hypothetical protein CVU66_02470 [Deltaproteobacteria bacterium HGW-Deltaproteobacteria-23]
MISIIVPTYNDNDVLDICLAALQSSDTAPLEVIVVDDASPESAADLVARYGYRYIRLEQNSGQATARNEGARIASGDILFFIDSDVAVRRDTIGKVEAAHKQAGVFVYQGISSATPLNKGFGPKLMALKLFYMLKDCREASYIHSHLFSIKKSVFAEVGGFDPSYRPPGCGEEFELGHRLRRKYTIHTDPDLLAEHRCHEVLPRAEALFYRAYVWGGLFKKVGKFEKTNASLSEASVGVLNTTALGFLVLSVFSIYFLYAVPILLVLQLALSSGFYRFLYREEGFVFMLRSILPNMLWSVAVVAGGARYFIESFLGRVK